MLATAYLASKHPELSPPSKDAFAAIVPEGELDYRAQNDIFHFVCAQLYDAKGRTANLMGASADAAVTSVTALLDALSARTRRASRRTSSRTGSRRATTPAPKSTGF